MSKKKARVHQYKPKASSHEGRGRRRVVTALALVLCLGTVGAVLAGWNSVNPAPLAPLTPPTPTPQVSQTPSKEYIYAGGRLIATEEPDRINVALSSNGATANASSFTTGYSPAGAINGDRKGLNGGQNGFWSTNGTGFPAWLEVTFDGMKTIDEIDLFNVQNSYSSPSTPTETMTFSLYGLTGFTVQYLQNSTWVTVSGGSITGNNLVWKKFTFNPLTTNKIRVLTSASPDNYSRLTEIEAWGQNSSAPVPANVALTASGASATASSSTTGYAPSGAIDGDRKGLNGGQNGYWANSVSGFPAWLQVNFGGQKTISEVDLFVIQDAYWAPSEPTETMTFSYYGLTAFEVQYWDGSNWVAVQNGSVTGNNKVWKKFTFAGVSTDKIRVWITGSADGWSRIAELEAWGN